MVFITSSWMLLLETLEIIAFQVSDFQLLNLVNLWYLKDLHLACLKFC